MIGANLYRSHGIYQPDGKHCTNIVQTLHKHYMNIAQTPDKLFGALYRERRFIDRMAFTNLMAVVELFRSLIASLAIVAKLYTGFPGPATNTSCH